MIRVNQVGQHLFYRFGGRAGSGSAFAYDAPPSAQAERPQLMQASLNPAETVRQASKAVAYTALLAQEAMTSSRQEDRREAAPRPASSPAAATPAPAPPRPAIAPVQATPTKAPAVQTAGLSIPTEEE